MPTAPAGNARLRFRELHEGDHAFALALLNDPGFLEHIGDRGVRDADQARTYLREGPMASYARHGYGLWGVECAGALAGMCGLVRRDTLPGPDLGYAFLPAARGRGLAREAAALTLAHAFGPLALDRVLAIVTEGNGASRRLLESLGLRSLGRQAVGESELLVYAIDRMEAFKPASDCGS